MAAYGEADPMKGAPVELSDLAAGVIENRNVVVTRETIAQLDSDYKFVDCKILFKDVETVMEGLRLGILTTKGDRHALLGI